MMSDLRIADFEILRFINIGCIKENPRLADVSLAGSISKPGTRNKETKPSMNGVVLTAPGTSNNSHYKAVTTTFQLDMQNSEIF